ncbi:MAG: ATP-binding protein [Chitinispirillaceae bacterium]|nr:ATP-binding protein [Chitinispirillaceae bacterium]
MIPRKTADIIKARLGRGKAIIVLGPRQVGKTTLMKSLFPQSQEGTRWFVGDDSDTRTLFSNATSTKLGTLLGKTTTLVIDEAQRIENIGLTIKLIIDTLPGLQVVVTGSSALELSNTINEPLTGRKFELNLFGVSFGEMARHSNLLEERRLLEHRLIFGYYPEIVTHPGEEQELLNNLCASYLYKDILAYQQIKKPLVLEKLIQCLALQVGSEVSYRELGQMCGLDPVTVERYIDLLEKAFVLFRLPALSRNMRNEIKQGRKVYFYDNGIRNAIIKNFNPLSLRQDSGALWENFCIVERMKWLHHEMKFANRFFWRTHAQQEIDYIEERDGKLFAFEIKWNSRKRAVVPKSFSDAYPGSEAAVITPENLEAFILDGQ